MANLIPQDGLTSEPELHRVPATSDDLFATTNHKTDLTAYLTASQAAQVRDCTASMLSAVADRMATRVLARAADWLTGAEHYQLGDPPTQRRTACGGQTNGSVPEVAYVCSREMAWRNLLVSNAEFCELLNALHIAGLPNTQHGAHLLFVPMPLERGGRIHWSPERGSWTVHPGFEHHPVYWVTWIGAAVFAVINSARLPTYAELCDLSAGVVPSNHSYALGNVTPVFDGIAPRGIHHPVGNLQVWCADGPPGSVDGPVERWIHGAAWNTPATTAEVDRQRSRHLLGASRGIGIRLVRDLTAPFTGPTVTQVAGRLGTWVDILADRSRTLDDLDSEIVQALQADIALRAHV